MALERVSSTELLVVSVRSANFISDSSGYNILTELSSMARMKSRAIDGLMVL